MVLEVHQSGFEAELSELEANFKGQLRQLETMVSERECGWESGDVGEHATMEDVVRKAGGAGEGVAECQGSQMCEAEMSQRCLPTPVYPAYVSSCVQPVTACMTIVYLQVPTPTTTQRNHRTTTNHRCGWGSSRECRGSCSCGI